LDRRHHVISIGDLANCVDNSFQGDMDCLNLVGDVIDTLLIGNHEMPYIDSTNSFSGFKHFPEIQEKINSLMDEDLIGPAVIVGNTLISHSGISRHFLSENDNAEYAFSRIEDHWNAKNWNYSWFSAVGYARFGRNPVGGMIWCDFDQEFFPTRFPQIVGHTPKYVRMKDNALCIDVGAKDQHTEPFILELA